MMHDVAIVSPWLWLVISGVQPCKFMMRDASSYQIPHLLIVYVFSHEITRARTLLPEARLQPTFPLKIPGSKKKGRYS